MILKLICNALKECPGHVVRPYECGPANAWVGSQAIASAKLPDMRENEPLDILRLSHCQAEIA